MREILIRAGKVAIRARLLETPTAERIWAALPIHAQAQMWGHEVYFRAPVSSDCEPEAREVVSAGEIAFWPDGNAIAIGFGPTPMSKKGEIRMASPCNIWAMALDDVSSLKSVHAGEDVTVVEANGPTEALSRCKRDQGAAARFSRDSVDAASMTLKLYYHPLSSFCHKVLIALYENDTPFEGEIVDLGNRDAHQRFFGLWPIGKMPLLHDESLRPDRSRILDHHRVPRSALSRPMRLLPEEEAPCLDARLWDRFFDHYVQFPMQKIVTDRLRAAGEHDPRGVAEARATLKTAYGMLEKHVADKTWAIGEAFRHCRLRGGPGAVLCRYRRAVRGGPPKGRGLFRAPPRASVVSSASSPRRVPISTSSRTRTPFRRASSMARRDPVSIGSYCRDARQMLVGPPGFEPGTRRL